MNLDHFFYPTSIAIVGASSKSGSVGNDVVKNLVEHGYQGSLFPVNPHTETLFNLPCYATLSDIGEAVEMVVIIVPAVFVPDIIREAGRLGTRSVVIISAGFRETGEEGILREQEVRAICAQYHITLLGPNCLGFINTEINLNASFAPSMPELGSVSLLSQSGAICTALLDSTRDQHLGFSKFISTGNKAGLRENDLLPYLAQDEGTSVIAFYAEELSNAHNLIQTGRAIISRAVPKPIIALKAGLTASGAAASSSHTGSLGGSAAAYRALFQQSRIINADTYGEFLDLLFVFSRNQLPEGDTVTVITNAGGPGVLATDAIENAHLTLTKLSPETQRKLAEILPPSSGVHNPVDMLGDARSDRYRAVLDIVIADQSVHMILVLLTPQSMTDTENIAEVIIDAKKKTLKPIVVAFIGGSSVQTGRDRLNTSQVAVLDTPEAGALALGKLAQAAHWRNTSTSETRVFEDIRTKDARNILHKASEQHRSLLETEVWEVLSAYGFPLLQNAVATNPKEATEKARLFKSDALALKIISPDIEHKSDAGGVMLNVSPHTIETAYEELLKRVTINKPNAHLQGALIVEMAQSGGTEIILGAKKEPGLGSIIMFGLGGIYVETFRDVSFRFAPLTQTDIEEMIHEIQAFPLLNGARGKQRIDTDAIAEYIARLSQLVTDFPEIEEIDINPILAFPDKKDFRILDGLIRLNTSSKVPR